MDMVEVAHAKKAQSLVSDHDYRLSLHHYTSLPDDMKVQAAKRAYELQSEVRRTSETPLSTQLQHQQQTLLKATGPVIFIRNGLNWLRQELH